jgi:hypothetical protein
MRLIHALPAASLGICLLLPAALSAQPRISPAECQNLRERLADHARVSEGVRRALGGAAARYPAGAVPATQAAPAPTAAAPDRATRLAQIAQQRQVLNDQRIAALVKFDFGRAYELQKQIDALDQEKAALEKQPADAGQPTSAPAPPPPATRPALSDADRIPCEELPAALETAKRIRRKELGAKEDLAAVVPLVPLKGQQHDQIARELASQFSAWPEAGAQLGLLDHDGDGRVDAFVDSPARDLFRVYRQRSDGRVSVDSFGVPGQSGPPHLDEIALRLEEAIWRQGGQNLAEHLATWRAGPARILSETADFAAALSHYVTGNFAEAAKVEGAAARSSEYQNLRGESIRQVETFAAVAGGILMRRAAMLPRSAGQEMWEETSVLVRPASYWRTDVEITVKREYRTAAGAPVGSRMVSGPGRLSLER